MTPDDDAPSPWFVPAVAAVVLLALAMPLGCLVGGSCRVSVKVNPQPAPEARP